MNIGDLFSRLGRGFGLFKALRTVTDQVTDLRVRVADGLVPSEESARAEAELFGRLNTYLADERWDEVVALKNSGRYEEARELAARLRSDHRL